MKRTTALFLLIAGCLSIGLFSLKYRVQTLEDLLAQTNRQIITDQQAIHVLRAEWSYLNEPARLGRLAGEYLGLEPVKPYQIRSISDLPEKGLEDHISGPGPVAGPVAVPVAEPLRKSVVDRR